MTAKRALQSIALLAILALSFGPTGSALAWSGCGNYFTVQWGDTLSGIAAMCGTSVGAIQAANPGLGWWVYAGQVLYMPSGSSSSPVQYPTPYYQPQTSGTYVVQWGDTMGNIAARQGVALSDLLAVNPQIWDPSLIYPGQVINLPAMGSSPLTMTFPYGNYQSTPYPPIYSTPVVSSLYSNLKVTYGHGLLVRSGPGINFPEIKSQFVSAVKFSAWQYRKNSLTTDSIGFVWVEVKLSPMVSGYSTGWILVRDSLGNYFTDPNLGPKIDPNDP